VLSRSGVVNSKFDNNNNKRKREELPGFFSNFGHARLKIWRRTASLQARLVKERLSLCRTRPKIKYGSIPAECIIVLFIILIIRVVNMSFTVKMRILTAECCRMLSRVACYLSPFISGLYNVRIIIPRCSQNSIKTEYQ